MEVAAIARSINSWIEHALYCAGGSGYEGKCSGAEARADLVRLESIAGLGFLVQHAVVSDSVATPLIAEHVSRLILEKHMIDEVIDHLAARGDVGRAMDLLFLPAVQSPGYRDQLFGANREMYTSMRDRFATRVILGYAGLGDREVLAMIGGGEFDLTEGDRVAGLPAPGIPLLCGEFVHFLSWFLRDHELTLEGFSRN